MTTPGGGGTSGEHPDAWDDTDEPYDETSAYDTPGTAEPDWGGDTVPMAPRSRARRGFGRRPAPQSARPDDVGVDELLAHGEPAESRRRRPPTLGRPRRRHDAWTDGNPPLDPYPEEGAAPRASRPAAATVPRAAAALGRGAVTGAVHGFGWVRGRAADGVTALRARRAVGGAGSGARAGAATVLRSLPLAVTMFTVIPLPASVTGGDPAGNGLAQRVLRWLPLVGGLLAVVGWALSLVFWPGSGGVTAVLGAGVWVCALALLTRGLHLDGLADVADGLGSRRPADEALAIMRKSDIGPFGVATIAATLLLEFASVLTVLTWANRPQALIVLVVAAVTGRIAALDAARPSVPAARDNGFGALVAGTVPPLVTAIAAVVTALGGWLLLSVTATGLVAALWLLLPVALGLVTGRAVTWHATRRLGGTTGDVFGAVIETSTTVALLTLAAIVGWSGLG